MKGTVTAFSLRRYCSAQSPSSAVSMVQREKRRSTYASDASADHKSNASGARLWYTLHSLMIHPKLLATGPPYMTGAPSCVCCSWGDGWTLRVADIGVSHVNSQDHELLQYRCSNCGWVRVVSLFHCLLNHIQTCRTRLRQIWFNKAILITLFSMVFSILTSLPTASITQLKQPYCISTIISSTPEGHRSCHVFASLICLPLSTPFTQHPNHLPFILVWNSRLCLKLI